MRPFSVIQRSFHFRRNNCILLLILQICSSLSKLVIINKVKYVKFWVKIYYPLFPVPHDNLLKVKVLIIMVSNRLHSSVDVSIFYDTSGISLQRSRKRMGCELPCSVSNTSKDQRSPILERTFLIGQFGNSGSTTWFLIISGTFYTQQPPRTRNKPMTA